MNSSRDLVARHLAAFNARDVDALLADFTPTARWITGDHEVAPGQLREFFTSAMESITPRLTHIRTISDGDAIAVPPPSCPHSPWV